MSPRIAYAFRALFAPRSKPLGPLPASVRAMAKARPFRSADYPAAFPLRDSNGITWAEVRRLRDEAEKKELAA
jgi:hypothetical protein